MKPVRVEIDGDSRIETYHVTFVFVRKYKGSELEWKTVFCKSDEREFADEVIEFLT